MLRFPFLNPRLRVDKVSKLIVIGKDKDEGKGRKPRRTRGRLRPNDERDRG